MSAPASGLTTGEVFAGRYQVIEELGRGGMGRVYKVFDLKVQERIALKIISPEIEAEEHVLARFRLELKLARRVTHKNVCRVFDIGEAEGKAYITMEYCPGDTLRGILAKTGELSLKAAVEYARQIAEGLAEAHKLGIVHRDLKPGNLIVDENHLLRIMDFGIARPVGGRLQTGENVIVGTPEYMAPEQVDGTGLDARTDLYALGIIIYEMVTGRPPFEGDSTLALAYKHKNEAPRLPAAHNPLVPSVLNALILKCLEKDPAKRYQDAAAVLADLGRIAEGLASTGRSRPFGPRPKAPASSRPAGRARLILGGTAVLLGSVIGALLLTRKTSPPPSPEGAPGWSDRVAILPFEDEKPDRSEEIFFSGISEDLRTKFARATALTVISQASTLGYPDLEDDIGRLGRTLKARHVVKGRGRLENDRLFLAVSLGDAASGAWLREWSYENPGAEYLALEDRVVEDIARELRVPFSGENLREMAKGESASTEAHRDYSLGRYYAQRYEKNGQSEDFDRAEAAYTESLAHDAHYALAYCGLGDLYEARGVGGNDRTAFPVMMKHYERAYRENPLLPESLGGMGWRSVYQGELDRAASYYRDAYRLAPRNYRVTLGMGALLRTIGLYDKAKKYLGEAMLIEPIDENPAIQYAYCCAYLGEYDAALAVMADVLKLPEANERRWFYNARILLLAQKFEPVETWQAGLGDGTKLPPNLRKALHRCRILLSAWKGDRPTVVALSASADPPFAYEVTNAYCLVGLKKEALVKIREGIRDGFKVTLDYLYPYLYLARNPYFDVLRSEPEFLSILAEAKSDYEDLGKKYEGL
jgi:serine/threonine-protein kinase